MSSPQLPIRYYYSLAEAAKELGCTENDLIHWGATQQIELVARLPIFQEGAETYPATDISYSFEIQRNSQNAYQTEKYFPETICFACLYNFDLSALEALDEVRVYTAYKIYEFSNHLGFTAFTTEEIVQKHFNLQGKEKGFNKLKINPEIDKLIYTHPFFEIWLRNDYCELNDISDNYLMINKQSLYIVSEEIQRLKNNTELTPIQLKLMAINKKPQPVSIQHRENLMRQIRANGLHPLELTQGKGGKAGSKSQLNSILVPDTMTISQFEKTWESAMRDQVIQYKK